LLRSSEVKSSIPNQIFLSKNYNNQIHQYIETSQDLNPHICPSLVIFVFAIRKLYFQCNANQEVATASPRFCNEPHPFHVIFVNVVLGTTFTSWSKHHFVVIRKAEKQVRKALHCGTKQQGISHVVLILFLLVWATWVLFFTHISFMVNRTFTTMLTKRMEHFQQGWRDFFEMIESERDK